MCCADHQTSTSVGGRVLRIVPCFVLFEMAPGQTKNAIAQSAILVLGLLLCPRHAADMQKTSHVTKWRPLLW